MAHATLHAENSHVFTHSPPFPTFNRSTLQQENFKVVLPLEDKNGSKMCFHRNFPDVLTWFAAHSALLCSMMRSNFEGHAAHTVHRNGYR